MAKPDSQVRHSFLLPFRVPGLFILVTGALGAFGQAPPEPLHLVVPRISPPPRLEDYLTTDSPPGLAITGFLQRNPKDREPATQQTTAYLAYDDANLYVAFVCQVSDPSQLRVRMARRESIFSDDQVGVNLDTFLDRQRSYVFLVNPLGIQLDGITAESGGDDYSFDTQWDSAGKLTESGYVVWMAIPFKSLRFPNRGDGAQQWGIALTRLIPANNEQDFVPGITNRLNGFHSQFAVLDGLTGVSPGRNIQLIPYGTFTGARILDEDAGAYVRQHEERAGLDGKLVLRDALTLDFTANPDFSQVESDAPQVTVNQRYEVFFPEKRPFFLENSDVFTFFFSRRIRDPQFGARPTGKLGHWAIGGLLIDDRAPGKEADSTSAAFGERALNAVGRLRYDFRNQSRAGLFVSARNFASSSNQLFGLDTRIRLNRQWFFNGQLAASRRTTLEGERFRGSTVYADLARSGRSFTYDLTYLGRSSDFQTELAFIPRVDMRQATQYLTYRWRPEHGPVLSYGPNSYVQATWNYDGELQDWTWRIPFNLELKGRTYIFGRHQLGSERVSGIELRQYHDQLTFSSQYIRWMGVDVGWTRGTRPNYFPASGLQPFLGTFTDLYLTLTFRPTSALLVDGTYLYSRLAARADSPGSGTIFSNPILRTRINYQFSPEWSLRTILDYSQLTPNAALIDRDRSRHAGLDVLLTWLPHPGTALYVGYTDGYDNKRLDPLAGVQPTQSQLSSTGRQIFVKSSWLFRF